MSDEKELKEQENELDEAQELERLELLNQSKKVKGEQLTLDNQGRFKSEKEIKEYAVGRIDDPERKHELYYKGIQKLLRENLPDGKSNKKLRRVIYDEKNLLINRGKRKNKKGIRGSDGRMAYKGDLETALNIISKWVWERGTPVDLYKKFFDKNVSLGYRKTSEKIEAKLSKIS